MEPLKLDSHVTVSSYGTIERVDPIASYLGISASYCTPIACALYRHPG